MKDFRKTARYSMQSNRIIPVRFSVIDGRIEAAEIASEEKTGVLIDISKNGLGFYTDTFLKPGSLLKVHHHSGSHTGIVMWTLKAQDRYRVGLMFTEDEEHGSA